MGSAESPETTFKGDKNLRHYTVDVAQHATKLGRTGRQCFL